MTQWEYKTVSTVVQAGMAQRPGEGWAEAHARHFEDELNQLGTDGWEAVGGVSLVTNGNYTPWVLLKRPKP